MRGGPSDRDAIQGLASRASDAHNMSLVIDQSIGGRQQQSEIGSVHARQAGVRHIEQVRVGPSYGRWFGRLGSNDQQASRPGSQGVPRYALAMIHREQQGLGGERLGQAHGMLDDGDALRGNLDRRRAPRRFPLGSLGEQRLHVANMSCCHERPPEVEVVEKLGDGGENFQVRACAALANH